MSIHESISKLEARGMLFSTFKAALNFYQFPTSRGWVLAERKLTEDADTPEKINACEVILEKIFEDNIHYGNKAVQIAQFDLRATPLVGALNQSKFVSQFVPTSRFPEPITASDLAQLKMEPTLVHVSPDTDGTSFTLFFYARAYQTEKEKFDVDQMTDDASRLRFAGYDQVVAYRRTPYVRIDSVYVNLSASRVEFRVDATRLESLDRMQEALKALKEAFRAYLSTHVDQGWKNIEFPLVNFYPKIKAVYNDLQGKVVRLGHHTATGAINHGKMKGLVGDLKEDPGHIAGMAAAVTESFSITKAFSYDEGYSSVRLSIPGKSVDAHQSSANISTSIIEDCYRKEQFEDMMSLLR